MKKLYIITTALLTLLAVACNKDDSTGGDPLPEVVVTGLQESYITYTRRDTLRINPEVANEGQYEFFWTAFSTNFTQGTGLVPKADTIGRAKGLDYVVTLTPGQYYLVFNVKHKATGVIKLIRLDMNVATLNMNGWYLLKDDGTKTDFDFIHKEGRINNWIAFYNDGKSLAGTAVKATFVPGFKMSLTSTDLFNTLVVLSDKDAGIYRVDNGKIVRSFDDMFFLKPATRKLQNVLTSMSGSNIELINDNKAYSMTKGALFTDLPNTYKPSPIAAVAAMDIGFDEITKSVFCYNNAAYSPLGTAGNDLKNMNANVVWIAGYAGIRSVAMALFRMNDGRGVLVKMNGQYGPLAGFSSPLIMSKDTLSAEHGLMQASVIGGNYDADYIYYAVGRNVYLTSVATRTESLQVTLPAGEVITSIQHIKYPQPMSATVPPTTDYLAIASYADGHYKIWLHKISSTGTIQSLATPNFEGEGRVTNVTYMEQGQGSRTF